MRRRSLWRHIILKKWVFKQNKVIRRTQISWNASRETIRAIVEDVLIEKEKERNGQDSNQADVSWSKKQRNLKDNRFPQS